MQMILLDISIGPEFDHPNITETDIYLCLIGGIYRVGQFTRYDNKLFLDDGSQNMIQYQQPNASNNSHWDVIYLISEAPSEISNRVGTNLTCPMWYNNKRQILSSTGQLILSVLPK